MWIGRFREEDKEIQDLREHLINVGNICREFSGKIKLESLGYLIGILHDMGKACIEFRDYILKVKDNPGVYWNAKIDHSTAAARYIYKSNGEIGSDNSSFEDSYKKLLAEIISIVIMGHHGGLIDFIDNKAESPFYKRINKELLNYDSVLKNFWLDLFNKDGVEDLFYNVSKEFIYFIKVHKPTPFEIGMVTKFLHSCLVDSDRLDAYVFNSSSKLHLESSEFYKYKNNLERYTSSKFKGKTNIDLMRSKISYECALAGINETGLFTLTVPTGGGKTLSSIRFALEHAIHNNLERIIYVVPYLSIIEQNAQAIREALDLEDELLEFHSNIVSDDNEELRLISDRWDKPIIFTSMVQFLEVFYDKQNSKRRRLHNLANSVIIYDECQAVPIHCTILFKRAIDFLTKYCNSSSVLMTATQPEIQNLEKSKLKSIEIISDIDGIFSVFKRVNIIDHTNNLYNDVNEVLDFVKSRMEQVDNLLFICNTKSSAKKIFNQIIIDIPDANVLYLSTNLCAAHRKDKLIMIKDYIKESNKGEKKLICITTQLIEAGVDISFQEVIRSLAGLDSIVQAAGRCNRNGEKEIANVYVVRLGFESLGKLPTIKSGQDATLKVIEDINRGNLDTDLLESNNIERYFKYFYIDNKERIKFKLDENIYMEEALGSNKFYGNSYQRRVKDEPLICKQSYKYSEDNFFVIEKDGFSVIVPYGDGKGLIQKLLGSSSLIEKKMLLNKCQMYTINLFNYEWDIIKNNKGIKDTELEGVYILAENFYGGDGIDLDGFANTDVAAYMDF